MAKLEELKIGTRPFFYPMHKQPVFQMGLIENQSAEFERLGVVLRLRHRNIREIPLDSRNTVRN